MLFVLFDGFRVNQVQLTLGYVVSADFSFVIIQIMNQSKCILGADGLELWNCY